MTTQRTAKVLADIATERQRQIVDKGFDDAVDDAHRAGTLTKAAIVYARFGSAVEPYRATEIASLTAGQQTVLNAIWPWDLKWLKPTTRRRDLVKAAALIVAEIERLDRLPVPVDPADPPS